MAYQSVFQRYELKYMLTGEQKAAVLSAMAPYMVPDAFGRTTIRNVYFDTDSYRLVRHSIEKTGYKEKLRLRSYSRAAPDSPVFVELKRKYRQVVFKRRLSLPEETAMAWLCGKCPCPVSAQIAREVEYFLSYYGTLRPVAFISYRREAYFAGEHPDFRVTFDDTILCRTEDLSLCGEARGNLLLPEGMTLMEIKCAGGIPLWMTRVLTQKHIYKTSFSKYGTAYQTMIFQK